MGKSVLERWINHPNTEDQSVWRCDVPLELEDGEKTFCKEEFLRLDRAITHVRGHLDHKPFPCEGHCKKQNWYAQEPSQYSDPNVISSTARFASKEYRYAHYQGPDLRKCDLW